MKLLPTIVVEIGALICLSGVLLLEKLELSPADMAFIRAMFAVIIGLFVVQVGYAQSLAERGRRQPQEQVAQGRIDPN